MFVSLIVSLMFVGCSEEEEIKDINQMPEFTPVSITPTEITTTGTLSCAVEGSDVDSDVQISYQWFDADGQVLSEEAELSVTPEQFSPEQRLSCHATVADEITSFTQYAHIVIDNTPPVVDTASLEGTEEAKLTDTVSCMATASDVDLEDPSFSFEWFNGTDVVGSTQELFLDPDTFAKGDALHCVATAKDGFDGSDTMMTDTFVIQNSVPEMVSLAFATEPVYSTDSVECVAEFADVDGDSLELDYVWTIDGVESSETSSILMGPFPVGANVVCSVTASDGESVSSASEVSLQIAN